MEFIPGLLVFGFIFVFGAIVFLAIRASRRQQAEKNKQIKTLGFKAPESPPANLQTRVEELYQGNKERKLALQNVYYRRDLDRDLYLFDVFDREGEDSEAGQEVFGVISSQLALPHFSLMTIPDFDRDSLIGGLMDKVLDKVMSLAGRYLGLQRVEFPDRPEFENQFVVFGQDPYAVRELLDRLPLSTLRDYPLPLQISGKGDFLTVDYSVSASYSSENLDLISQFQHFNEITRVFLR